MTFNEAFVIAMRRSRSFQNHVEKVNDSIVKGEPSACMIFCVEGEVFYYGFDGVDLQAGRHTRKRGKELCDNHRALVIL